MEGNDEGQGRPEMSPQWRSPCSFSNLLHPRDSVSVILQVPLANFWRPPSRAPSPLNLLSASAFYPSSPSKSLFKPPALSLWRHVVPGNLDTCSSVWQHPLLPGGGHIFLSLAHLQYPLLTGAVFSHLFNFAGPSHLPRNSLLSLDLQIIPLHTSACLGKVSA